MEKASERYERDWIRVSDDRHDRTLLQQSEERKSRRYVDLEDQIEIPDPDEDYLDFYSDFY